MQVSLADIKVACDGLIISDDGNCARMKDKGLNFNRFDKSEIEQSIPARFYRQVQHHGERLAVGSRDWGDMTYRELNRRSNRIANHILAMRGPIREPIAFMLDQSAGAIVTILGILKAGKFYVALNPQSAPAALNHILTGCNPGLIVTDAKYSPLLASLGQHASHCVKLDELYAHGIDTDPDQFIAPDSIAYIYFTSGSTGPPKGVTDSHRNILHNVMRYTNNLCIGSADRLSLIQPCAFSGTVSSLFGALLNGAAVFPFDLSSNGMAQLARWIDSEELTIFHSVPAIFEQLASQEGQYRHLRVIRLEGDRSAPAHIEAYRRYFTSNCILVNGLGTTETGIIRQFFIDHATQLPSGPVPVGEAVEDMEIRLLDDDGNCVPDGQIGEIAVRSKYLAVGYWNNPELTAERMIPDKMDLGYRIYRTGDMGRMIGDGCLQYIERKDFARRIRGQRIEFAEIENALCSLPAIRNAVVTIRENRRGFEQLVAYLVPRDRLPSVTELRNRLSDTLPPIMIPAKFVPVDALPVDSNCKVRRYDLPIPDRKRPPLEAKFDPANTERQKNIVESFECVLDVNPVGLDDDFFELGGDSLMATELIISLEKKLGRACPPEFPVTARTVRQLDEILGSRVGAIRALPVNDAVAKQTLFVINGAHFYRNLATLLNGHLSIVAVQWSHYFEPMGSDTLARLAAAYVTEIGRYQPNGPYLLCGNCFDGVIAYEVARQIRTAGHQVAFLGLIDTAFPSAPMENSGNGIFKISARLREHLRRMRVAAYRYLVPYFPEGFLTGFLIRQFRRDLMLYRPGRYDGNAVLFSLGRCGDFREWQRVTGNLSLVRIRSKTDPKQSSNKPHLIEHPYVINLAEVLLKLLKPQTAAPSGRL